MEPEDALWTDRSVFESELDGLIDSVIKSSSSPSLKRAATSSVPNKRVKTAHQESEDSQQSNGYNLHVHPQRKELLDQAESVILNDHSSPVDNRAQSRSASDPGMRFNSVSSGTVTPSKTSISYAKRPKTWQTLSNTVKRQWDPRKDDLEYEALLEQRRNEKLQNVDRYVPGHKPREPRPVSRLKRFPFDRLPEKIQRKILSLLLVSSDPITIDFYWLRPFVKGHARIPDVIKTVEHEGTSYSFPVSWTKLLSDVEVMRRDMLQFNEALETRGAKTRWSRCPCRGLTTSLLRVSRHVHDIAAQVLYGENVFKFPCATSAWMQLDSFLATIGSKNVATIRHIRIHVPLWHRGVQQDFVEGAVVDVLSPASRLAVIKPPPHDRLLSAIKHAVNMLLGGNLVTLLLNLENGPSADFWGGRYMSDKRLISLAEAEEFVERKRKGIELLSQLSDVLATCHNRPVLSLNRPSRSSPLDKKEFSKRLPGLVAEAEKYGWQLDPHLW